jgi:hypothetical protein
MAQSYDLHVEEQKKMETLVVLRGHTTPETAYLVYSQLLRCNIRYWLEFNPKKGFRLCSQTTNPKATPPQDIWNKPKTSTYMMLGVMGLNGAGHVVWDGCSVYDLDKVKDFVARYGASFDENQSRMAAAAQRAQDAYERRRAEKAANGVFY